MTYLHLLNFDNLVPEVACYVFYPARRYVYCDFDKNYVTFASTLFWYHTQPIRRLGTLGPLSTDS